jgi:hypothetical protein
MTSASSAIIQDIDIMRRRGLASLAFVYHDFNEYRKRDLRGLFSTVLVQLCHQSNSYCDILSKFYSAHADGSKPPSDDELARCLKEILELRGQAPVFLVVDALDEYSNPSALSPPREKFLMCIKELIELQLPNLRICVTSRPEADIKSVLDPLTSYFVSLHDERGQIQDIHNYVNFVVHTNEEMRRWKPEDKQLVIDILTNRADGM